MASNDTKDGGPCQIWRRVSDTGLGQYLSSDVSVFVTPWDEKRAKSCEAKEEAGVTRPAHRCNRISTDNAASRSPLAVSWFSRELANKREPLFFISEVNVASPQETGIAKLGYHSSSAVLLLRCPTPFPAWVTTRLPYVPCSARNGAARAPSQ